MPTVAHPVAPAEEALLRSGAVHRATLSSPNFLMYADAQGVIRIVSTAAERLTAYAPGDLINKRTLPSLLDPEELCSRAAGLSVELGVPIAVGLHTLVCKATRGMDDLYEFNFLRKDDSFLRALLSFRVLRDVDGGIIGYLMMGTDRVARQERAELLLCD